MDAAFHRYSTDGDPPPRPGREKGRYLADPKLALAVNTALAAEQPLLVTGEPGTGKTTLAWSIARELDLWDEEARDFAVDEFVTRTDSVGADLLYRYDYLARLRDATVGDARAKQHHNYISYHGLGKAIVSGGERVVLVDEIDKATSDFPNDLLHEFDRMAFTVPETGQEHASETRPIVVVTSNEERSLPQAFLRRCVYFHIPFPGADLLKRILTERLGLSAGGRGPSTDRERLIRDRAPELLEPAVEAFVELRSQRWEKKPATAELIKWTEVLALAGRSADDVRAGRWPDLMAWALAKTRADLERLVGATP